MLYLTLVGGAIYLYVLYLAIYRGIKDRHTRKLGTLKRFSRVCRCKPTANRFTPSEHLRCGIMVCDKFFKVYMPNRSVTYVIGEKEPLFEDRLILDGYQLSSYFYDRPYKIAYTNDMAFTSLQSLNDGGITNSLHITTLRSKRLRFIYKLKLGSPSFHYYKVKGGIVVNKDGFKIEITLPKGASSVELKPKGAYFELRFYLRVMGTLDASISVKLFNSSTAISLSHANMLLLSDCIYLSQFRDLPNFDRRTSQHTLKVCKQFKLNPSKSILNHTFSDQINAILYNYFDVYCTGDNSVYRELKPLSIYNHTQPKKAKYLRKQFCSLMGDYIKFNYKRTPNDLLCRINGLYFKEYYMYTYISHGDIISLKNIYTGEEIFVDIFDKCFYKTAKFSTIYYKNQNKRILDGIFKLQVIGDQTIESLLHKTKQNIISAYMRSYSFISMYKVIYTSKTLTYYDQKYLNSLEHNKDYIALTKYLYVGVIGAVLEKDIIRFYNTDYPSDITLAVDDKTLIKYATTPLRVRYNNIIYNNVYIITL